MSVEYTNEQLWKLCEKLPNELKEVVFSEETANIIWDVCEKNEIEEVSKVAKYTGYVLMGVLLPDKLKEVLEEKLNLEKEVVEKVAHEINRFIFYPVKPLLEELYKIEIAPPAKPTGITPPPEEKPPTPPGKDTYREVAE